MCDQYLSTQREIMQKEMYFIYSLYRERHKQEERREALGSSAFITFILNECWGIIYVLGIYSELEKYILICKEHGRLC